MRLKWEPDATSGGFVCQVDNVTLFAVPERTTTRHFRTKPARGTQWRAGCSVWDAPSRTISRFGRDAYMDLQPSAKDARLLAEQIFARAASSRES